MATPLSKRPLDLVIVLWSVVHIPVTLLIDGQSAFGADRVPGFAAKALEDYVQQYNDNVVRQNALWFQSIVWVEIFVQLPFFVAAAYAFAACKGWIRIPCIMYGCCALTAIVPVLTELLLADNKIINKLYLSGIYSAFVFMPIIILLRALLCPSMFGSFDEQTRQKWQ